MAGKFRISHSLAGHHKPWHHGHHFAFWAYQKIDSGKEEVLENPVFSRTLWRRRWDSNPRALADNLISSRWKRVSFGAFWALLCAFQNAGNPWFYWGSRRFHCRHKALGIFPVKADFPEKCEHSVSVLWAQTVLTLYGAHFWECRNQSKNIIFWDSLCYW